jgi:hypothetical protein
LTKSIFLPRKQKLFTMSDIAIRVKKIIVDKLGVDEAEVTNEASFTNDLGADSLDTVGINHGIRKRVQYFYSRRTSRNNYYCWSSCCLFRRARKIILYYFIS